MPKIKALLILLWFLFAAFLLLLVTVLWVLTPDSSLNILLFYTSSLVSSFSLFTLIGFYLRKRFGVREWLHYHLVLSARQGLWLALILNVSLFLLSQNWFTWLNASFLILALVFLESYLLTER